MYSFSNDYSEIAHPRVLRALNKYAYQQNIGYSLDIHCDNARKKIKKLVGDSKAAVHFLPGGTMVNLVFLATNLGTHEAVIAADTAHIYVHETGAIEATGHKIITIPNYDGKIRAYDVEKAYLEHTDEHMVKPKIVFISNSTEYGTIYYKKDLQELRNVCDKYGLLLYLDGARLANALVADDNDLTLKEIHQLCDAFYLGGTKNGMLFGEALVIKNKALDNHVRYVIKQRGGLTAKGFLLGIQYETLLKDDLYLKNATHANKMAQKIRVSLENKGIKFYNNSSTNQIFPILTPQQIESLSSKFTFIPMDAVNENSRAVRFVCSWATDEKAVDELISCF